MRIIHRVVLTKETKDSVVTRITERIVETYGDNVFLASTTVPGSAESDPQVVEVKCNICTRTFDLDNSGKCRCPSCGSRDASIL